MGGVQIRKGQLMGLLAPDLMEEVQQETERVAIDAYSSRTEIALFDEMVAEESLKQVSKAFWRIHCCEGYLNRFAVAAKSCGVAERYQ